MSEPYLGEIRMFAGSYAPRGFALCFGEIMPINGNEALYSLLGINFGGDGRTTFALPDLRGRVPMGVGQGSGSIHDFDIGDKIGSEVNVLTLAQMPVHSHTATFHGDATSAPINGNVNINCYDGAAGENSPKGHYPANVVSEAGGRGNPYPGYSTTSNSQMASDIGDFSGIASLNITGTVTVSATGGSSPFGIMQPSLAIIFGIATQGLYPPRS